MIIIFFFFKYNLKNFDYNFKNKIKLIINNIYNATTFNKLIFYYKIKKI